MTIIDIIGWLVIGLIVGLLARFLVPGRDPMGCFATALLGIAGSFLGGFISRFIFGPPPAGQYVRPGFLISMVGAILLLILWRVIRRHP